MAATYLSRLPVYPSFQSFRVHETFHGLKDTDNVDSMHAANDSDVCLTNFCTLKKTQLPVFERRLHATTSVLYEETGRISCVGAQRKQTTCSL
jgi:hypothetical protein